MTGPGPEPFGPESRYTVRFILMPAQEAVTCTVVTSLGELKAATIAGIHKAHKYPDQRMGEISIVKVETDFTLDQERGFIDYWGTNV